MRIVGISGSLRRVSSNSALIEAAARLVPAGAQLSAFDRLAAIPPFNPDADGDDAPGPVLHMRLVLGTCDAVLISSPEYAHGVPGVLKNALDWVVGSGELVGKPVALINTSPRATHAWRSLAETLTVMSARVIPGASVTVPLQGRALDANGIVRDPALAALVQSALLRLADAVSA